MKKDKKSGSIKRMFQDMGKDKSLLGIMVLIICVAKLCLAISPSVAGKITNQLVISINTGKFDLKNIGIWCLLLAVLYMIGNGVDGFTNKYIVKISQGLVRKLRNKAQIKLQYLKIKYLDTHQAGEILSYVTNDVQTLATSLESTAATMIGQLVLLIGVMVMMIVTNPILALIYILTLTLGFLLLTTISKKTGKLFKAQQESVGSLNSIISDSYSNHMLIKSFGCEKAKSEAFDKANEQFYKTYIKSRFASGFMLPVSVTITNISYIGLCVVGGIMLIKNKITLGDFQAFVFFGNMIGTPLTTLSNSMNTMINGFSALARIYRFLDEDEEDKEEPQKILDTSNIKGEVTFKHVRFGYLPDKELMHDVSFKAKPGTKMAIVGPSGAGKTTLINLLLRFYDIQGGKITIDETDIKDISKGNLRQAFGMVLQDTWIFDGTIADNIGYGKLDATREEIIAAAKKVQCDTFIEKLPDGYDTYISEENSILSSGEKQLLAIARTVLANPQILILDEATSQVDTKTELLITQAMENLMKNRTSFMIAHRLFTIKNADAIIYMENGDIKEVGNHKELMRLGGRYATLYNSASDK